MYNLFFLAGIDYRNLDSPVKFRLYIIVVAVPFRYSQTQESSWDHLAVVGR